MKVAIVGLCFLGVIAAVCAALLVKGLRPPVIVVQNAPSTQPGATAAPQVTVLCAAQDLLPMTVVEGGMVGSQSIPPGEAPKGYLSNTTDVVGKVVKTPMTAGQPYTATCFYEESGSRLLASVIPAGKRAVAISVTDYAGLDGLIYPGSLVDVMASFEPGGTVGGHHDATTVTLLEKVQVLAFEQHTVVSPDKSITDMDGVPRGGMRRVTLLVDTRQSKTLELGMKLGSLSLALRNPLDSTAADKEPITLGSMMGEQPVAEQPAAPSPFTAPPPVTRAPETPHWDVIVMQGTTSETRSYAVPVAQEASKP